MVSSGGGAGRTVELRWTDDRGTERRSTVQAAGSGDVPAGRTVELRYDPDDPAGQVYVSGDETSARLRDLSFGFLLTVLVLAAVVIVTGVHLARRLAAERRPAAPLPVRYARSRRGVVQRSWLVVTEDGRDWWVPVHWEPVLLGLAPGKPAPVHGRPSRDRVAGGRRRPGCRCGRAAGAGRPRRPACGRPRRTRRRAPVGLLRHFRSDGGAARRSRRWPGCCGRTWTGPAVGGWGGGDRGAGRRALLAADDDRLGPDLTDPRPDLSGRRTRGG